MKDIKQRVKDLALQMHKDGFNQGIVTGARGLKKAILENVQHCSQLWLDCQILRFKTNQNKYKTNY